MGKQWLVGHGQDSIRVRRNNRLVRGVRLRGYALLGRVALRQCERGHANGQQQRDAKDAPNKRRSNGGANFFFHRRIGCGTTVLAKSAPTWQDIFGNFNYEWTPIITPHFPRAGRRIRILLLLVLEKRACHRRIDHGCRLVIQIPS